MRKPRPSPLPRVPGTLEIARRPGWRPVLPVLTGALCAALALSASPSRGEPAAEAGSAAQQLAKPANRLELRELRGDWTLSRNPLAFMSENLHFHKGTGLEYRRRMLVGERSVVLGLQGPVVRKKKSLGLTVVVRF